MWLALYGLLETTCRAGRDPAAAYDGCYLFSYGSGCGAALMEGKFGPATGKQVAKFDLEGALARRRRISVDEYETLMDGHETDVVPAELPREAAGAFRLAGVRKAKRIYERTAKDAQQS